MTTPKPPRPEKSTVLSSESAAMNLVRSNRAEKEKLLGFSRRVGDVADDTSS